MTGGRSSAGAMLGGDATEGWLAGGAAHAASNAPITTGRMLYHTPLFILGRGAEVPRVTRGPYYIEGPDQGHLTPDLTAD